VFEGQSGQLLPCGQYNDELENDELEFEFDDELKLFDDELELLLDDPALVFMGVAVPLPQACNKTKTNTNKKCLADIQNS